MAKMISIGTITREDQIKAIKIADRNYEIENGRKHHHTVTKDKKRDSSKKACRQWKQSGFAY
jgi:hypothetical protein